MHAEIKPSPLLCTVQISAGCVPSGVLSPSAGCNVVTDIITLNETVSV